MGASIRPTTGFDPDAALAKAQAALDAQQTGQPQPFNPDKALAAAQEELARRGQAPSGAGDSYATHALNAATFGIGGKIAPQIVASIGHLVPDAINERLKSKLGPEWDLHLSVAQRQQMDNAVMKQQETDHGVASALGTVTGAVASPINKIGEAVGAAGKAAGALNRAGRAVVGGATSGALYGAATAPPGDRAESAATGAAVGGAGGYIGDRVVGGIAKVIRGMFPKASPEEAVAAVDAARKAQQAERYGAIEDTPDIKDSEVHRLMQDPRFVKAWNEKAVPNIATADRSAPIQPIADAQTPGNKPWSDMTFDEQFQRAGGTPMKKGMSVPAPSQADATQAYPLRGIDAMKKSLSGLYEGGRTQGTMSSDDQAALRARLGGLINRVDDIVPGYQSARQGSEQHFGLLKDISRPGDGGTRIPLNPKGSQVSLGDVGSAALHPTTGVPGLLMKGMAADATEGPGARVAANLRAGRYAEVAPQTIKTVQQAYPAPYRFGDPTSGAAAGGLAGSAAANPVIANLLHTLAEQRANQSATPDSTAQGGS